MTNSTFTDPKEEIVDHLAALRAFAISLTRNSAVADDMVQDAIVKAWTNIDKFQPGTNMRAWLFTILRNTYYSSCRRAKREVADSEGVLVEALCEKPAHDGRLQMADFRVAFAQLSDEQREVLVLVGANGFSYEEAAEMCGVAIGTIKSRVNRARARLSDLMHVDDSEAIEMTDAHTMAVVTSRPTAA